MMIRQSSIRSVRALSKTHAIFGKPVKAGLVESGAGFIAIPRVSCRLYGPKAALAVECTPANGQD
jgi:hypothetical protein